MTTIAEVVTVPVTTTVTVNQKRALPVNALAGLLESTLGTDYVSRIIRRLGGMLFEDPNQGGGGEKKVASRDLLKNGFLHGVAVLLRDWSDRRV